MTSCVRSFQQEGVTAVYVCRLLPLTCPAPDIVEAILVDRTEQALTFERYLPVIEGAARPARLKLGCAVHLPKGTPP
jgi:hypothetical protein